MGWIVMPCTSSLVTTLAWFDREFPDRVFTVADLREIVIRPTRWLDTDLHV